MKGEYDGMCSVERERERDMVLCMCVSECRMSSPLDGLGEHKYKTHATL